MFDSGEVTGGARLITPRDCCRAAIGREFNHLLDREMCSPKSFSCETSTLKCTFRSLGIILVHFEKEKTAIATFGWLPQWHCGLHL